MQRAKFALVVRSVIGTAAVVAVVVVFAVTGDTTKRFTVGMGVALGLIIWGIGELIIRSTRGTAR
jgi:hypothetical protein